MARRTIPLLLLLAACAAPPPPRLDAGLDPDLAAARRLLLASKTPIPLTVEGAPVSLEPDAGTRVARLASDAVQWAAASFAPAEQTATGPRLVMRFGAAGGDAAACAAGGSSSGPGDADRLRAVLCDGARPVAEVVALGNTAERSTAEALVTRTTARLFPPLTGNTPSEAGWSPGAPGISLGGWIGSGGGGGIGVGLGF